MVCFLVFVCCASTVNCLLQPFNVPWLYRNTNKVYSFLPVNMEAWTIHGNGFLCFCVNVSCLRKDNTKQKKDQTVKLNASAMSFAETGKTVFRWAHQSVHVWRSQQSLPVYVHIWVCSSSGCLWVCCVYLPTNSEEARERLREGESGSVSACKLKWLHLCGSAPWQKAWVRPSLRGVIDGRVAVATRCKQERAVSLFAAWRVSLSLSAMCHCHTRCAACDEQGQRECLLGGNHGGGGFGGGCMCLSKSLIHISLRHFCFFLLLLSSSHIIDRSLHAQQKKTWTWIWIQTADSSLLYLPHVKMS